MAIRLLIVDEHPPIRAGVRALLRTDPGLVPVAEAASAPDALVAIERTRPDAALVDYQLAAADGLHLCTDAKRALPSLRVVVYSALVDPFLAVVATVAGADGVLEKSAPIERIPTPYGQWLQGSRSCPRFPPQFARSSVLASNRMSCRYSAWQSRAWLCRISPGPSAPPKRRPPRVIERCGGLEAGAFPRLTATQYAGGRRWGAAGRGMHGPTIGRRPQVIEPSRKRKGAEMTNTILCAVDVHTRPAVAWTADALAYGFNSRVALVHVAKDPPLFVSRADRERGRNVANTRAGEVLAHFRDEITGPEEVEELVELGSPLERLVEVAQARQPEMIVVGSRGRGRFASALGGSVSRALISKSPCPVVIVSPAAAGRLAAQRVASPLRQQNGIVCGLPDGDKSLPVAGVAKRLARRLGKRLVLSPTSALTATAKAEDANLIVVGEKDLNGTRPALLAPTDPHLVRNAPCPVRRGARAHRRARRGAPHR